MQATSPDYYVRMKDNIRIQLENAKRKNPLPEYVEGKGFPKECIDCHDIFYCPTSNNFGQSRRCESCKRTHRLNYMKKFRNGFRVKKQAPIPIHCIECNAFIKNDVPTDQQKHRFCKKCMSGRRSKLQNIRIQASTPSGYVEGMGFTKKCMDCNDMIYCKSGPQYGHSVRCDICRSKRRYEQGKVHRSSSLTPEKAWEYYMNKVNKDPEKFRKYQRDQQRAKRENERCHYTTRMYIQIRGLLNPRIQA